jgi:hypothetical protein
MIYLTSSPPATPQFSSLLGDLSTPQNVIRVMKVKSKTRGLDDVAVHAVYVQGTSMSPINVADLKFAFEKHGKVVDIRIFDRRQVRRY